MLLQAIDEAIRYIDSLDYLTPAQVAEFKKLAEKVYILASEAGLAHALPKSSEVGPEVAVPGFPPVAFLSKLNLPGDWQEHPEPHFLVCVSPQWRWHEDMDVLKKLAQSRAAANDQTPAAVWVGPDKVRIADQTLCLEPQPAAVLGALVKLGAATSKQLQVESGYPDAVGILKKLRKNLDELAPFIRLPGRRGQGGYSTTIVST